MFFHQKRIKVPPYFCPVCKQEIEDFWELSPYFEEMAQKHGYQAGCPEMLNKQQYACKVCNACDRDRLIVYFFTQKLSATTEGALLNIAPSAPVRSYMDTEFPNIKQHSADLFMPDVDLKLDITQMPEIATQSYNWFICSHVLEHVYDDRAAMRELYRILKPGGFGVVLVPINLERKETDEALNLSGEENWRRFGQDDHVRSYAKRDFVTRLKSTGFRVKQFGINHFGRTTFARLGLSDTSVLYVVYH